jgi:hypothetical protein
LMAQAPSSHWAPGTCGSSSTRPLPAHCGAAGRENVPGVMRTVFGDESYPAHRKSPGLNPSLKLANPSKKVWTRPIESGSVEIR